MANRTDRFGNIILVQKLIIAELMLFVGLGFGGLWYGVGIPLI